LLGLVLKEGGLCWDWSNKRGATVLWRPVLMMKEARVPAENQQTLVNTGITPSTKLD